MPEILVVYYSRNGSVQQMAKLIARGIEMVPGVSARLRTVPPVSSNIGETAIAIPEEGSPYVEIDDLRACIGIALGSPTRFGNMAAPMKYFIDQLGSIWHDGVLVGKPATVFTSSSSMHGGQEMTLATMMFPLIHLGMVITGGRCIIERFAKWCKRSFDRGMLVCHPFAPALGGDGGTAVPLS